MNMQSTMAADASTSPGSTFEADTLTGQIAELALGYHFEDLPEDVVNTAKNAVLDHVSLAVRGASEELTQILGQELFGKAVTAEDLLPGGLTDPYLPKIAMLRATSAHAIDFDDTLPPAMAAHTGGQVVGALIALASEMPISGKDFLTAVVAGFEVASRIGGLLTMDHYEKGFHPTGTVGIFGVAAACGRILGLDQDQMRMAFGIAATQASGIKCVFGTMTKPFNAGNSAAGGLLAARLAAKSFTSAVDAVDEDKGYLDLFMGKAEDRLIAGPDQYFILQNAFKFHAACHATHAMIEGLKKMQTEHGFSTEQVEKVELTTHPIGVKTASIGVPKSGLECKFSYSQVGASVLAGLDTAADSTFDDAVLENEVVNGLREKIAIKLVDDSQPFATSITVQMSDGSRLETDYDMVAELLSDYSLVSQKLQDKFRTLMDASIEQSRTEKLLVAIQSLGDSGDVSETLTI